jgi:Domain of unknown function (DUF4168)
METLTRSLFVAALMIGWYLCVPIANAQRAPSEAPSSGLSSPAPSITEEKLDAAATALQRVVRIEDDYGKRLAEAPQAEKERIVAEANDALEKAVADQGLSVEEYSSILGGEKRSRRAQKNHSAHTSTAERPELINPL